MASTNDFQFQNLQLNADLEPVRDHFRRCFLESYGHLLDPLVLEHLLGGLASDNLGGLAPFADEKVRIAYNDSKIVGSVIWARRSKMVYIWGFYIRHAHQRKKLGTELLRQIACQQETPAIMELTVIEQSVNAVSFYKSVGFRVVSETQYDVTPEQAFPAFAMIAKSEDIERGLSASA